MNLVLYFTGTGNCLHCAKMISEKIEDTEIIRLDIKTDLKNLQEKLDLASKVGIILPVYAGTLPYLARDILERLKFNPACYLYSISTCAGSDMSFHYDLNEIVNKNSKRSIDKSFTMIYPSNFQTNMAPKDEDAVRQIIQKAKADMQRVIGEIKSEAKKEVKSKKFMSSLAGMSLKLAVKKDRDRNFYADESCISCSMCAKACPVANITMKDGKPQWHNNCEACMACIGICPPKAIQYKEKTKTWGRYLNPEIDKKELFIEE
ncbi:MAG: EFR1 family ferrodoxin [Finegoldia sp.]|nr:EFR1 family ferrodoxin [Finegoldia sp.]